MRTAALVPLQCREESQRDMRNQLGSCFGLLVSRFLSVTAFALLTVRTMRRSWLDLVFAMLVPTFALVGLTLLLRDVIDTGTMSYAQYILPAVVVQAMLFGALTTTDRAAGRRPAG